MRNCGCEKHLCPISGIQCVEEALLQQFAIHLIIGRAILQTLIRPTDACICFELLRRCEAYFVSHPDDLNVRRIAYLYLRFCIKMMNWVRRNQVRLFEIEGGHHDTSERKGYIEMRVWLDNANSYLSFKLKTSGTLLVQCITLSDYACRLMDDPLD